MPSPVLSVSVRPPTLDASKGLAKVMFWPLVSIQIGPVLLKIWAE